MARKAVSDAGEAAAPTPRYVVESVAKSAELLLLFKEHRELRLSDVGELIGVSHSTVHRLLTTLAASGLVKQNPLTRCYEPGPELVAIAQTLAPAASRWTYLRPFLTELSERVGETIHVMTLQHTDVAFIEAAEAQTPLRVGSRLGAIMPASCVSGGKILLAALTDDDLLRRYPKEQLLTLTKRSIPTRTKLIAELNQIRRRGWATNFGESEPDVSGVAVAIPPSRAEVPMALAVAAPKSRVAMAQVKAIAAELHRTADLIASAGAG